MIQFQQLEDPLSTVPRRLQRQSHGTIRVPADVAVREGKRGVSGYYVSGITTG